MSKQSEQQKLKKAVKFLIINVIIFVVVFGSGLITLYVTDKIATPEFKKEQFISQGSLGEYESLEELSDALAQKFIDKYFSSIADELMLDGLSGNDFVYASKKVDAVNYYIYRDGEKFWFRIDSLNDEANKFYRDEESDPFVTEGEWFMYCFTSTMNKIYTREELKEIGEAKLDLIKYDYTGASVTYTFDNRVYILVESDEKVKEYADRLEGLEETDYAIYVVQSVDNYTSRDYALRYAGDENVNYRER